MMKSKKAEQAGVWSVVKVAGLSALAFLTAFVAIVAVNYAGMTILAKTPGAVNADGIPPAFTAQSSVLIIVFVAGALEAFFLVWMAPMRPKMHALIYLFLITLIDVAAMVDFWGKVPVWFAIMMLVIIPLQVWPGMFAGLKMRRKKIVPKN